MLALLVITPQTMTMPVLVTSLTGNLGDLDLLQVVVQKVITEVGGPWR